MILFRRPKPRPSGHTAAKRSIGYQRDHLANATKNKLIELTTAIDDNSDELPELLADIFPYVDTMTGAIRQLDAILNAEPKTSAHGKRRTYTFSSRLVLDIYQNLTSDPDGRERLLLGTGIETVTGNVIISETMDVRTSQQTAAHVEAHPGHTAVQIDQLDSSGHKLWLMAHSHIMHGKASTRPSQTDINHQNRMVECGRPDMLGMICSLDGWLRVFSTAKAFDINVYGNGVTVTDDSPREKIIKLDISTEKTDATVPASLVTHV